MSGITGIGYDPALTGREITSVMDLFDPAFKGKVGMFGDTEDMPNLTLLGMGVEPSASTPDDWNAAAAMLLTKQSDDGVVRQYYGQNYVSALTTGDVALTMAWSADILQLQLGGSPQLKFVVPDEGGAAVDRQPLHPRVRRASPRRADVHGLHLPSRCRRHDRRLDPERLARAGVAAGAPGSGQPGRGEPARVPEQDAMYDRLHGYRVLTREEQQAWDQIFQPIYQG